MNKHHVSSHETAITKTLCLITFAAQFNVSQLGNQTRINSNSPRNTSPCINAACPPHYLPQTHRHPLAAVRVPASAAWMARFVLRALTVSGGLRRARVEVESSTSPLKWLAFMVHTVLELEERATQVQETKLSFEKHTHTNTTRNEWRVFVASLKVGIRGFYLIVFFKSHSNNRWQQPVVANTACQSYNLFESGFEPQAASLSAEAGIHVRT